MDYRACRQRNDDDGTPFRNWIRQQRGLESNTQVGYIGTDLDLVWYNYKRAMLMLLEEKQHMTEIKPAQEAAEYIVHQCLQFALNDSGLTLNSLRKPIPPKITYCGWHLIQFENTSPDDGRIYIDGIPVTKGQFIKFLQFEWTPTIQYYREEQEQIRAAYSRSGLDEIAQHIKQTTRMNHPEIARLRTLWQEKKQELERIETMFSDDDDDWDESDYVDPEMAEAELLLQERDSEDYADIEYEDHA